MKKSSISALTLGLTLSFASTALASPTINITGDVRLESRSIDDQIMSPWETYNQSSFQARTRLKLESKVSDDTTVFARYSTRNNLGAGETSTRASNFYGVNNSTSGFDWYGVKQRIGTWDMSVGHQSVNLGQGGIINTGSDVIGTTEFFNGLVATTKTGKFNVKIIGGKSVYEPDISYIGYPDRTSSEIYGLDFSTKVTGKLTLGGAWASFNAPVAFYHNGTKQQNWAINMKYDTTPNFSINGEYVKSDATADTSAYFMAGTYKWNKDSFTVRYNKVQDASVDRVLSGIGSWSYPLKGAYGDTWFGTDYHGFTYTYTHQVNKNLSLDVKYMDLSSHGANGSDKELAIGASMKF